eukprot:350689-Chlamydomonas_euryale.AAC.7
MEAWIFLLRATPFDTVGGDGGGITPANDEGTGRPPEAALQNAWLGAGEAGWHGRLEGRARVCAHMHTPEHANSPRAHMIVY